MSFKDYLASKMAERGIKASALAKKAGTSKQNIGRILNNTPHPVSGALPTVSREMVDKIAAAMSVDVSEARIAAGFAPLDQETRENMSAEFLFKFGAGLIGFDALTDAQKEIVQRTAQSLIDAIRRESQPELQEYNEPIIPVKPSGEISSEAESKKRSKPA